MTRETVNKLSGLIRDKDLEIEALKGRNDSLVALVHSQKPKEEDVEENSAKAEELKDSINKLTKEKKV